MSRKIHILLTFIVVLSTTTAFADKIDNTERAVKTVPSVEAINQKLKVILPEASLILKQEVSIVDGKLVSKKLLANGVRVEEVRLSKLDLSTVRIDKFLGNDYYFITFFSEERKPSVDFAYEQMDVTAKEASLDQFNIKALENSGKIDHFCLSLSSKEDAEEVVAMIKQFVANH